MGALHIAVHRNYPAVVELLLLNRKTDLNLTSPLHGCPLHVAARSDSVKLVQQLLLYGASPQSADHKGLSPMQVTSSKRIIATIERHMAERRKSEESSDGDSSS
jgi:ankyrin repeat protein